MAGTAEAVSGVRRVAGPQPPPAVPAQVGVQCLLPGAEGVEQVQGPLPGIPLVVPLEQEQQRNGDPPGLLALGAGHEAPGEAAGRRDARLGHRQPDAEGRPPRVPDRAADLGQREEGVQGGPPLRDRLLDQWADEGLEDLVDRLAGLHRPP